jgi:hypothetical protein
MALKVMQNPTHHQGNRLRRLTNSLRSQKVDPSSNPNRHANRITTFTHYGFPSLTHHPVPDRSDGKVIVCFRRHLALATCWSEHFL